jgi:hypothetical protein
MAAYDKPRRITPFEVPDLRCLLVRGDYYAERVGDRIDLVPSDHLPGNPPVICIHVVEQVATSTRRRRAR